MAKKVSIKSQIDYYRNICKHLEASADDNMSLIDCSKKYGGYFDYFYNYLRNGRERALRSGAITRSEYDYYAKLFNRIKNNKGQKLRSEECKKNNIPTSEPEIIHIDNPDKKTFGREVRSETEFVLINGDEKLGKITHYEYCVMGRHNKLITGTISRELMNKIYALYVKEGIDLTQRTASRDISVELNVDFHIFQKILRVFNITKNSMPFALHVLEENPLDHSIEKTLQLKENLFFKRIESEKIKKIEQRNIQLLNENMELKNKIGVTKEWLSSLKFDNVTPYRIQQHKINTKRALLVYISDMHIGAMVEKDSLYTNDYNKEEVVRRLSTILSKISHETAIFGRFDRIIVCNLGDSLDGYNSETTRGGHKLPQNMSNKEQFTTFIEVMKNFIDTLYVMGVSNNIDYYSVGTDNHSGEFGYFANKVLEQYLNLKYPDMKVEIFEKFIGDITYGKHVLLFSHGKDDKNMFKNMPLYLDVKTENQINEYLDYNGIYSNSIHFIKADLHQTSTSYGKRFRYKNVSSLFGSSKWIHLNFGNTPPACDFDIIDHDDIQNIYEGHINLKPNLLV